MSPALMAAEMLEQPDVLARLAARFDDHADRVRAIVPQPLGGVVFVARGSSDNAAVYGRYLAELVSGRPAGLAAPSLLTLYDAPVDYDGRLVVALSQSGATPEIVKIEDASKLGFDIIEVGENNIELTLEKKKQIAAKLKSKDLVALWKVGKKDPRRQLSFDQSITKINEAIEVGSEKILLEGNLGYAVGIYDEKGNIKWNIVGAVTSKISPNKIIFETPLEIQQSAMIAEFGQRVNLGETNLENVISIESQRKGFLSRSSYGISSMKKIAKGSPATKFIYYIIRTRNSMEQSELINITNLPRRTVQTGLEELKDQGLIVEKTNLDDIRKKIYHIVKDEWI